MNKTIAIQLKAAFLIIVFALNMLVGFACSIGMDLGFNTGHHDDKEINETSVHVHSDGKQHHHGDEDKKDNCCHDKVVKLAEIDKAIPQPGNLFAGQLFFTPFIVSYFYSDISYDSQVTASIKYFTRSYHPPIPDIRIAIQSFLI